MFNCLHVSDWIVVFDICTDRRPAAVGGLDDRSSEETLLKYLFDGYNPTARPVINSSLTVAVNLRFSLLQIQDLVIL